MNAQPARSTPTPAEILAVLAEIRRDLAASRGHIVNAVRVSRAPVR